MESKKMENMIDPNLLKWEFTKIKGFLSKELIELQNGGLKVVKVESDAAYPFHNHPDRTEFIYVLDGVPEIIIGDNYHIGKNGDFFVLPRSIKHSIKNSSNSDCILLIGAIKS